MKRENVLRLWLTCLMAAVMLSLMDITALGTYWHERVGLTAGLLVLMHLGLDHRQVGVLFKRLFKKSTPYRVRLGYIVDALLLLSLALILWTGAGISVTLLHGFVLPDRHFYMGLHSCAANIMLLLLVAHLWLHKGWLRNTLSGWSKLWRSAVTRGRALAWTASLVLILLSIALAAAANQTADSEPGTQNPQATAEAALSAGVVFTPKTLAQYDGKDGRPAYIAVDGLVYDVGDYFIDGEHHQGIRAGVDITGQVTRRKCINALTHCPVVGTMTSEADESAPQIQPRQERRHGR